ncbi:MAG: hypothetical protein RIK87_09120 [Fuerstiella sp.]
MPTQNPELSHLSSHAPLLANLKSLSRKELKRLFLDLPTPGIEEINGEYQGILLNQGNTAITAVTRFFVNKEGVWLGKAFQPMSETSGRGYNLFQTRSGIRRSLRMQLVLSDDNDQKRLTIEYSSLNEGLVGSISDELRRVAPGLFLGIGIVPLGGRLFPTLSRKVTFALVGPTGDFRVEAAESDVFVQHDKFDSIAA